MPLPLLVGALYGLGLAVASFLAAGFGHGCYVPIGVFAAPVTLLGADAGPAPCLILPFVWAAAAFLAWSADDDLMERLFLGCIALHYATAILAVSVGPADDWDSLGRAAVPALLGFGIYGGGQIWLWRVFLARRQVARSDTPANL